MIFSENRFTLFRIMLWWSDPDIRISSQQVPLRMLESWMTSRHKFLGEFLDLTFDFEFAAGRVSNVKSTPLGYFFVSRYF
jgi:hypothetical protein